MAWGGGGWQNGMGGGGTTLRAVKTCVIWVVIFNVFATGCSSGAFSAGAGAQANRVHAKHRPYAHAYDMKMCARAHLS